MRLRRSTFLVAATTVVFLHQLWTRKFHQTKSLSKISPRLLSWNASPNKSVSGDPCTIDWTKSENVWMIETGGRPISESSISCAIESVAAKMPDFCVRLMNISLDSIATSKHTEVHESQILHLTHLRNTRIVKLTNAASILPDIWDFASIVSKSPCRVFHFSDLLRMALVYVYGGTYVDTDVIALRRLDNAEKFLIRLFTREAFSTNLFKLPKGDKLLWLILQSYRSHYQPSSYFSLVQSAVNTMRKHCNKKCGVHSALVQGHPRNNSPIQCCDITVFSSQFGQCKMDVPLHEVLDSQCAMYHYHLTFSLKMAGQEHTRSQIEQIRELSANHCPVTMRTFGEIVTQSRKLEAINGHEECKVVY